MTYDVVIIGGGHHGLIAAALLAKAGRRTLVLERGDGVGGCAVTRELAPGFRVPALAHRAAIAPEIIRDLALEKHGLEILRPTAIATAPLPNGRLLTLWRDRSRSVQAIAPCSAPDAERYPRFLDSFAAMASVFRSLTASVPPSVDEPNAADLISLLKTARAFRKLEKEDSYRLLRWLPMPVADAMQEWFECEPLRALIGAGGVFGSFLGPRSPGSAALLMLLGSGESHPLAPGWAAKGGTGAVGEAIARAARAAGAELRIGASVQEVVVRNGSATAVVLASGDRIEARTIISTASPKRTLLELVDSVHLPREFVSQLRRIRTRGTLAKVNFALTAVPAFSGLEGLDGEEQAAVVSGALRLCPTLDALERAFDHAKYGRWSDEPWIELTVPSVMDPGLSSSGHVASAYVQYVPGQLREGTWDQERERLLRAIIGTIDKYAPGFGRSIVAAELLTPLDLEREHGLDGGHIFQGELALDQLFIGRPLLGWSRFTTPLRNLYLCGAGTHPGTGLDGRSGALAAGVVLGMRSSSSSDDSSRTSSA